LELHTNYARQTLLIEIQIHTSPREINRIYNIVETEEIPVKASYNSGRGEYVIEVILSGRKNMQDVKMTGLEKILDEINEALEPDFTLEVYYWYTGVDKPGGQKR